MVEWLTRKQLYLRLPDTLQVSLLFGKKQLSSFVGYRMLCCRLTVVIPPFDVLIVGPWQKSSVLSFVGYRMLR